MDLRRLIFVEGETANRHMSASALLLRIRDPNNPSLLRNSFRRRKRRANHMSSRFLMFWTAEGHRT